MTIARDTVMGEEPVYGIATGNRFAMVEIGDDIDDPSEFYNLIEKEKAEKKKADKKKKEKKMEKKKEEEKKPEPKKEEDNKDNNNSRGRGRGRGRNNNRGRGNNDNRRYNRTDDEALPPRLQEGEEKPEGEEGQEKRRGGGYKGRGGNNRRGRGNYRGRQYDRHSGSDRSGVKAQDKRDGNGAHNWGSPTDDTPQDWGVSTDKDDTTPENKEPSGFDNIEQPSGFDNIEGATDQPGEAGETNDAEDGPEQITYEEYQAKIAEEKKAKQAFNIRKAGENEDDSQWKNFAPLKKESKDTYMGGNDEYEKIIVRGGRKKNLVDLDVKFSTPTRRGGNRTRDRGRDRRDYTQGKESSSASLNLENQSEFPTLS